MNKSFLMATAQRDKTPVNFEQAIDELEKLVNDLEHGEHSLEESLQLFERGIKLTRSCQRQLEQAEQKIQILQHDEEQDFALPAEDEVADATNSPSD